MSSISVALVTFACISLGILIGSLLRRALPHHHLRDDSKDVVKMGTGFIATLTALVLGLLISSAKSTFDAVNTGLVQNGARVIALDRVLSQYGPEAADLRLTLRRTLAGVIVHMWPEQKSAVAGVEPIEAQRGMELIRAGINKLDPQNPSQKWIHGQALQISGDLSQGRWQLIEQGEVALPAPLLTVLVFWLVMLFACFSLLSPSNLTVISVLLCCAFSVSGAIFLIMEMCHPETGFMKASCLPLLKAFTLLGQ